MLRNLSLVNLHLIQNIVIFGQTCDIILNQIDRIVLHKNIHHDMAICGQKNILPYFS